MAAEREGWIYNMGKVIGIDLGTTNSCVAVLEGGEPAIISTIEGNRTMPSVVAFTAQGERLVGEAAKRQAAVNAQRTFFSIKRKMGQDVWVQVDGRKYSPQELSAMILMRLKKDAEEHLGEEVNDAVITVPAYFNDAQRQATRDAGRIAGLKVRRIINEPTAAALAYGLDHAQPQKILVYDLGGGTFDVSIIEISDGLIEVLATSGDNHLGGDDFDQCLVDYLVDQFRRSQHIDLRKDVTAMARVREAAEKAKKELSQMSLTQVNLPFIWNGKEGARHMDIEISRSTFEQLIDPLVKKTAAPVSDALHQAGITADVIGRVLLVGGSTRIPAVQRMVQDIIGKEPSKNINPDECVALGASIQGGKFNNETMLRSSGDLILMDVTPLSLSIETMGGIATHLIERNTIIPVRESQIFTTAGNFQTSVDIKVLQGECRFAKDNTLLGNFRLTGIKRALAGVPQIEVTFDIDANGIVNVSARDLGTGKQQQITISSRTRLSEEAVEQARRQAKEYEKQEQERKQALDILNEVQQYLYEAQEKIEQAQKSMGRTRRYQLRAQYGELKRKTAKIRPERITLPQAEEILQLKNELKQHIESV